MNKLSKKNLLGTKDLERNKGRDKVFLGPYIFIRHQMSNEKSLFLYISYAKIHTVL